MAGFLKWLFGGASPRPRGYQKLVAWVEQNTPARFDGSQQPEMVKRHLEAKLAELQKQKGWGKKRLAGFKHFVESRSYDRLITKK